MSNFSQSQAVRTREEITTNNTSDSRYLAIKALMAPRHPNSCGMILDEVVLR